MSICIVDTSVFCNVLRVPGRDQAHDEVLEELERLIDADWALLLPVAAIYETGNHIAQGANGALRRKASLTFVAQVERAFQGEAPWTPTPVYSNDDLLQWLVEFPDSAMAGVSFVDLSIKKIFEEQCSRYPARRVRIWSLDADLAGHDRRP